MNKEHARCIYLFFLLFCSTCALTQTFSCQVYFKAYAQQENRHGSYLLDCLINQTWQTIAAVQYNNPQKNASTLSIYFELTLPIKSPIQDKIDLRFFSDAPIYTYSLPSETLSKILTIKQALATL